MSILDLIISQVTGDTTVANLAAKVGLSPEQVEGAVGALAKSHTEQGDTLEGAAAKTGLDTGVLSQIVEQVGGEGSLGQYANLLSQDNGIMSKLGGFLDRDGDGSPLDDLQGMASGLFGKK